MTENQAMVVFVASVFCFCMWSLLSLPICTVAAAADLRLRWDPSTGVVDGYRVFERQKGEKYDYHNPAWEGSNTRCTIYNLDESVVHYFVVRAFNEFGESVNSNEVAADLRVQENPDPAPGPSDNGDFSVDLLRPSTYRVASLQEGDKYYLDRDYILVAIPSELSTGGELWVMTRNSDKGNTSESLMQLGISHPCTIYVAYDRRAASVPDWLNDNFWLTPLSIRVTDRMGYFDVYQQYFSEETVTLGGNMARGASGAQTNYIVIIQP